ncbi:MAG: Ig-like domain-containing protein, partial [Planctomycetota bacterium]
QSLDRLLVIGGTRFYDQATGQPYHPGNELLGADAFRLVHPDGKVDVLDGDGRLTRQEWADGDVWHFTDSGISLTDSLFLPWIQNDDGTIASIRLPASLSAAGDLHYLYDEAGRLIEVAESVNARSLHRYGYESLESSALTVAVSDSGNNTSYPSGNTLTRNLGRAIDFAGAEIIDALEPGQTNQYAFTIDADQLRSTSEGVVWVRAMVERYRSLFVADTPTIAGLEPVSRSVDGDRTVALFAIQRADQYLLEIAGASAADQGRYQVYLDVVGDINRDGAVDGLDSELLSRVQGTFVDELAYDEAADFNSDGAITVADSQLLAANFGFTSAFTALAVSDRFVTNPSFPTYTPDQGTGNPPTPEIPEDPSTGSDTRITPPASQPPDVDPTELTPVSLAPTDGAAFQIRNGLFDFGSADWSVRGNVNFAGGAATLREADGERTSLRQAFFVPDNASILRFTVSGLNLVATDSRTPDAFEVALLDANDFTPLAGQIASGGSDALLNFSSDGTYVAAPAVTVGDALSEDPSLDLGGSTGPGASAGDKLLIQIDLSGVPLGMLAVLSFDLLGFAESASEVSIDNVFIVAGQLRAPIANTDLVATNEDMPVVFDVLANDEDNEAMLDPTTLEIITPPSHGQLFVTAGTGSVTYSPNEDYAGNDSFTYRVKDADGFVSNEAFVSIDVAPVTDTPLLTVEQTVGPQDTELPLVIDASAMDIDGSEEVMVTIRSLPQGATLSNGLRIADGHYELRQDELQGLSLLPGSGWSGTANLDVKVTAQDQPADVVEVSEQLNLVVESVVVDPFSISGFEVNRGEVQRSLIHTLSVTFNQDAWIVDPSSDIFIIDLNGNETRVQPERYSYDKETFQLSIDVDGLITTDEQYFLALRMAGIASNANRLQTLSAGPDFGGDYLPLPFHRLLADMNGNNEVDVEDWRDIRESLNSRSDLPRYVRHRDLTGEGIIDRHDFVAWRNQLGDTTDDVPPQVIAAVTLPDNALPLVNAYQSDAELSLVINDVSDTSSLTLSVNGSAAVEMTADLSDDNAIRLPLSEVFARAGQPFVEGNHTISFVASDVFGNTSDPEVLDFEIDDTAPPIPTTPVLVDADGNEITETTINDPNVILRSVGTTGNMVRIFRGDVFVGLGIAQSPVDVETNLSGLGDGTYVFTATSEDPVGNQSDPSGELRITIDTTAPLIESITLDPATDSGALGDQTTEDALVNLVGRTEPNALVSVVGAAISTTADASGDFLLTGVPIDFGPNRLIVASADELGNTRERSINLFRPRLESVPPVLAATLTNDTGKYFNDGVTFTGDVNGAIDEASGVARLLLAVTNTSAETSTVYESETVDLVSALSGVTYSLTTADIEAAIGATLDDGAVTYTFTAVDIYDNASVPQTVRFTLDRTAPDGPSAPDLSPESDLGHSNVDNITSATKIDLGFEIAEDSTVEILVDGVVAESFLLPAGENEVTLNGVGEGTRSISTRVTDLAGNVSAVSSPLTIQIDVTPPSGVTAEILEPTVVDSDAGSVSGASDPGTRVSLIRGLDSNTVIAETTAAADGSYTFSDVRLANGLNRFRVLAEDVAGNTIDTTAVLRFEAPDLSAPELSLSLANDTGSSDSDLLTKDATVTGMVNDASRIASFQVSVDGSAFVNSLGSLVDNMFTLDRSVLEAVKDARLEDGDVTVRLLATDVVGHVSDVVELTFELDTTRPDTPAPLGLDPASDSGTIGDGFTNESPLIFNTSVDATDAEVILFSDGEEVDRQAGGGDVVLSVTSLPGRHRYVAQSVDAAGNVSFFTAPRFITFDNEFIAPTVEILAAQRRLDLGSNNHTTTAPVTLVGTVEAGSAIQLVGLPNFTQADGLGRYVLENIPLEPGSNSFTVRATDEAGNTATTDIEVIFVDQAAPEFEIRLANDTGRSDSDTRTMDPSITGLITDDSEITQLLGSIDGLPAVDITSALNEDLLTLDLAALEGIIGTTLPDGRHVLALMATDSFGNEGFTEFQFDLDRTGPPLQSPPDLVTSSDLGHDGFDNLTADTEPTIRLYAERSALVKFFVDGDFVGEVLSTGVAQYTLPTLASGTYDVTATIEDAAGNLSGPSDSLVLTIDETSPTPVTLEMLGFHQSNVDPNHTTDAQVNLLGTADPGVRITMTGQSETPIVDASGFFFFVADLQVGENVFEVTAEDEAGNLVEQTFVFTRGELLPPTFDLAVTENGALTAPMIEGELRSENAIATALVSFDPTFTDRVVDLTPFLSGGQFSLSASDLEAIQGAPFVDGEHSIYFSATDTAGRQSVPTEVTWNRDAASEAALQTSVTPIGNDYRYVITATGAGNLAQRLDEVTVPLPVDVTATDIIAPAMWAVAYTAGDDAIVFTANDPLTDGLSGLNDLTFAFTAATAPTPGLASTVMTDLSLMESRSVDVALRVPSETGLVAVTDYYGSSASATLSVDTSTGLRANDASGVSDVETFDAMTVWGAAVSVAADGSFTLTPGGRYVGVGSTETIVDSFRYSLRSSGGQLSTATVYVTIFGENQSPTAVEDVPSSSAVSLYTRAGVPVVINEIDLTSNDTDPDVNDRLSVTTINGTSSNGALVSIIDGNFVYDPTGVAAFDALPAGASLLDEITYTIEDPDGLSDVGIAQIWVQSSFNLVPTASPSTITVTEDGDIDAAFTSLLEGAVDADALPTDGPLSLVQETVLSVRGASVTLAADGSFLYDAAGATVVQALAPGETIDDSFEFRVTDGIDPSATAVVTLNVTGVNDAPTAGDNEYFGLSADGLLTTTLVNGLLSNDFDVDSAGPLTIDPSRTDVLSTGGAQVTLRPDGTFDYDPAGAFAELADGEVAIDTFTYVVIDDRGAESIATARIEVIGVDDAPVAGTDGIERGFWTVATQRIEVPASDGVLANDFDFDSASNGTILEASFDGFSQYGARVIVNADGSFSYDPTVSPTIAQLQAESKSKSFARTP